MLRDVVHELKRCFRRDRADKRAAHRRSAVVLQQAARDSRFLTDAMRTFVLKPASLTRRAFPIITMDLEDNPYFSLIANCWIPSPTGDTNLSTTAVHHHGDMLLSTCTAFGGGYEHFLFKKPRLRDRDGELFDIELIEQSRHPLHHLLFIDAWHAHCPFYPGELSVTLGLWSHQFATRWQDYAKRLGFVARHRNMLGRLVRRLRMNKLLDVRSVDYYDYHPTSEGFKGMRARIQIPHGTTADYLNNLLYVLQGTANDDLVEVVLQRLEGTPEGALPEVRTACTAIRRGERLRGRIAMNQINIPHMHFTREQLLESLAQTKANASNGGELLSA